LQDAKSTYRNPVAFLYGNNELSEMEVKKTIPFTIASKKKKSCINLTKNVKDIYNKNYKAHRKELKETLEDG
jgi:hypothetical protein